ncbi:MAG TPA: mechanosensitive ion channel family protein [Holophaga sp.]|nr:mechanosensitive ion channel family protein [Holophaga sp.]
MGLFNAASWDAFLQWMGKTGWHKLQKLGLVLLTCFLLLWAIRLVGRAVRRAVDDGKEGVTSEAERRADTLASVLNHVAWVVVAVFFVLTSLQEFGINVGPLIAGAGIAGVALGFGAQSLVKDWISGFFLLMENQFGVGDIISVDDKHAGVVERMTLRITQLRDTEGRAHYIPNGSMVRVVVMSKEFARALVDVDVAYDADLDAAMELLKTEGARLVQDLPESALEPTEVLGVNQLGGSGITIRTLTKTAPGKQWEVAREFRRRIVLAFREAGIEIPFPQQVVHHRNRQA